MASWTERRRAGGGAQPLPSNQMNFAELDGSADLLVQYDNAIDATTLDPNAFETAPNAHVSTGVTQTNDAQIGLSFGVDISEETELIYTGTTPHVVSPQTIAIT